MADAALSIKIGADTQDAVGGLKKVEFSLNDCNKALKELKAIRGDVIDNASLTSANKKIADLTTSIKTLERAGTSGFDELGNAISKTSNPLEKAYGEIRKLAYIIPGIGIGGLFALAFEGIAAAVSSFIGSADKAAAAQLKLNETLGAGSASAQGEISELTALSTIVLDTANSTKVRKEAYEKLQSLYPGYLGNLSFEKVSYDNLKIALDNVSSALVRQAQIKGLEGAIEETYKNLNKTVAEGGTTFEKVTGNVSGFVSALEKSFNLSKNVAGNIGKQWEEITGAFEKAKTGSIAHSLGDDMSDAAKAVDILQEKLTKLLTDSFIKGDAALKPPKPPKIKVKPEIEFEPQHEALNLGTFLNLDNFKDGKIFSEKLSKELSKYPPRLDFSDAVKKAINDRAILKNAEDLAKEMGKVLENGINNGLADVGRAIGDALGSGGNALQAAGQSILQTMGALLEQLGEGLIKIGTIEQALKALGSLSPVAKIAIGIAAEVAGAALISSATSRHKFATGGIVTGPTNALIGEAGPEVIFPLEKLNSFIRNKTGASNANVNVTGEISGNNLRLVLARANKNQGFV